MKSNYFVKYVIIALPILLVLSCKVPKLDIQDESRSMPLSYRNSNDTITIGKTNWRTYFNDSALVSLIDTALAHNQEFNIVKQEIEIAQNEVKTRKGEYLPFVNLMAGTEYDRAGAYTSLEAIKENIKADTKGDAVVSNSNFVIGAVASWEVDIWKKLRNAKKAAVLRYLGSVEGKNLTQTNLIAEIASSYYELLAFDNLLEIVEQNIQLQTDALKVVKLQKESARVTLLAVNRFEAQLLRTQNLKFEIRQQIVETENRINFLTGRFPKPITRNTASFITIAFDSIQSGIPSQLLSNRPDIRKAELELAASKLDIEVARANFYPSLGIKAGLGLQAFNPKFIFNPHSILFNAAGDLLSPLINRNAIEATYATANAKQKQAVYSYEQSILNGYLEVLNQLSKIENYHQSFQTKSKEVATLLESVTIANQLFYSARADYGEVLFTQREVLDARMELIEIKMKLLNTKVNIYRSLGGGWN